MRNYYLIFLLLCVPFQIIAQGSILTNAIPGINLVHQNIDCFNNSAVAYNPIQDMYYAVRSGNVNFTLETWTGSGVPVFNTTAGFDWRGMWWNPFFSQLEGNGYNALGLYKANLNASGHALNTGTVLFTGQNQPDIQSIGDFDFDANEVLYYFNGNIHRYNRTNMTFISSYPITGTPAPIVNLNTNTVMYTGCLGKEIALLDNVNKKVYLYDKANGAFVGASTLPSSAVTSNYSRTSYANGLVWLFDLANITWQSYKVLDSCGITTPCPVVNTNFSQSICNGDSFFVNGVWQFNSGIYKDTFLNVAGCDSISTLNLVVHPPANSIINDTICQGDNSFGYSTTGVFKDTFLNANGCDSIRTINLTVNPLPNVGALVAPNDTICSNASIILNGTGALNYSWSNGVTNNVTLTPTASNTYTVTGTDVNGCSNSSSINIIIVQAPIISIVTNPANTNICKGQSITLTANGGANYIWSHGQANGSAIIPQTSTIYSVTGLSTNNCSASNTISIIVNPSYKLLDTVTFCEGGSINYNGIIIQTGGIYNVNLQTSLGCDSTIEVFAKEIIQPRTEDILPNNSCKGATVSLKTLANNSIYNYMWQSNTGIIQSQTQNSALILFDKIGTNIFSLTITPPTPCLPITIVDKIEIHEPSAEIIKLINKNNVCFGDTILLSNKLNKNYAFDWQPASNFINNNSQIASAILTASTVVTLTVSDSFNCSSTDTMSLNLLNCCTVFVPNAFSPNNNGQNEIFTPLMEENVKLENFIVFNQWGERVFETRQKNIGWDGYYKGQACLLDTYYYILEYSCDGIKNIKRGDVLLLR